MVQSEPHGVPAGSLGASPPPTLFLTPAGCVCTAPAALKHHRQQGTDRPAAASALQEIK